MKTFGQYPSKVGGCQQGVSLVELMVAVAIGLFILGGVVTVVMSAKRTYILQDHQARMQENARFALDQITGELRMAGYSTCGKTAQMVSSVNDAGEWTTGNEGLIGHEGNTASGVTNFPDPFDDDAYIDPDGVVQKNSDMVIIRRADGGTEVTVTDHNASSANIDLGKNHEFEVGDILIMADSDCSSVAVFQMTGSNTSNSNKAQHNKGNANPSPGNCTKSLSGANGANCDNNKLDDKGESFSSGSKLMKFLVTGYYLRLNPNGVPALYTRSVSQSGGNLITTAQELVAGVERLQLRYGVDVNDDGVADRYSAADNISASDWELVNAIRVQMQIRSIDPVHSENTTFSYTDINGTTMSYNDRFARYVVTRTIALRNRGF